MFFLSLSYPPFSTLFRRAIGLRAQLTVHKSGRNQTTGKTYVIINRSASDPRTGAECVHLGATTGGMPDQLRSLTREPKRTPLQKPDD